MRMRNRALAFAIAISGAGVAASQEKTRPLQPTEQELESFQLPPVEIEAAAPFPEPSAAFRISGLGMFAASATDFATTELGLARGLSEGNPVASDRGLRLVHHVVGPAAVYWTTEHLRRKGKDKLALTLRIALMAAYGYATVHNLRQVSGLPSSF
jgi:hypothetical protein